jgi:3D (Asp-Asp-Asp) domain-containing protein
MKTLAIVCLLGVGVVCTPRPTMCVTMSIVTVTAYHNCPGSKTLGITASGKRVKAGVIAVSRDVERNLNLDFGDQLLLHGLGVFEFQDRMASRWRQKVDIFMDSENRASRFGVRRYVVLVKLA